jgi:complex III assembly factor LYRM7
MTTLLAARHEARKSFENNRGLATGSDELSKQISHADEVAKFLRENVVQGQADATGNYSTSERIRIRQWMIMN